MGFPVNQTQRVRPTDRLPIIDVNADIVFCIDATQSMVPFINEAKKNMLSLYEKVEEALKQKKRVIKQFRIKIIAFRDIYSEYTHAFMESDYFVMPKQRAELNNFVNSIIPCYGGELKESSLEALSKAIDSNWVELSSNGKAHHLIVMITDDEAHDLDDPRRVYWTQSGWYPSGIPQDLDALYDKWISSRTRLNQDRKRLLILAPHCQPWTTISTKWDLVDAVYSPAGKGCPDPQMNVIVKWLVESVE